MRRNLAFDEVTQDLRISLRTLMRSPLLAITILATVGLGIGATTVIFTAIDAALLRPLPYKDPEQLVRIYTDAPPYVFRFSVADYHALDAEQTHFTHVAGYTSRTVAFSDGLAAERVWAKEVTWTYFRVLGIQPALGRDFTQPEGRPGGHAAAIVSHGFWQTRFGGRPDVVGRPVRLDGKDYTLVGVLPANVGPLEQMHQFFVVAQWGTPPRKGPFFYTAIGRLRESASRWAAAEELRAINRRMFPRWRASYQDEKATWGMMDLKTHVVGDVGTVAGVALAAVALVWLIACTNASNLLIARVTSRRRELAIRSALGASRWRVIRYLLAESIVLATGAAAVGTSLAWIGVRALRELGADYFPRTHEVALDGAALAVMSALTAMSALLFGVIPAVHGTGAPLDESLRAEGRSSTGSTGVRRLRRALVGTQFAIATPLIIMGALLFASLNELGRVDIGFETRGIVTASLALPEGQYPDLGRAEAFWKELRGRVAALPGVTTVALADGLPPDGVGNFNNFDLEDFPTSAGQSQPVSPWVAVTPEYFRLLGLTLLEGRLLEERDALRPTIESVVVERAWARRHFPNGSAIGKRFREGGCTACPWTTVVGVVSDVKYAGLDNTDGAVYWPIVPALRSRFLVVRTAMSPDAVIPSVREVVRQLDATLPLSNVATMDELIAQSLQRPRSLAGLVGGFALVALVLATVGIYGVMAYYVQQHAKDISIRMALGGSARDVLRLIVGQGMQVVALGIMVGVAVALSMTRLISGLLFGVGAADTATFASVTIAMITVALVACVVPARRATKLEPAVVLRSE